ncbi:hypothetical protein ACXR2U_08775 [Jatrophihabitans sp. YIM 134969]
MRQAVAFLDVAVVALALAGAATTRSRAWGWVLMLASGAWLPANNAVLEGPILVTVAADHGLTVSDCFGIAGVIVGGLLTWPPGRWRPGWWLVARAAVVAGVIVLGFLTALVVTDERVEDQFGSQGRSPAVRVHRASAVPLAP